MAEGGTLTFNTELDNGELEKSLEEARKKVEDLKKSLEKSDGKKSAIEQEMEAGRAAIQETERKLEDLKALLAELEGVSPEDMWEWHGAQQEIAGVKQAIDETTASLEKQRAAQEKIEGKWQDLDTEVSDYRARLVEAEAEAANLGTQVAESAERASSATSGMAASVSNAFERLGNRIAGLVTRVFVFSVITKALNTLKNGIADALMQNDRFSASWTALTSAAQGFANGIANYVAPVVSAVVSAVTSAIVGLAKAIDTVLGTGLVKSIAASQKAAQATWRQTDASKASAKAAETAAKQKAKAEEQYTKQVEAAQKRQAKAEASAQERYNKAVESAQKRQQDALDRREKAEQKAAKRLAEAQEDAAERAAKAEAKVNERNAEAQATYDKRVAKQEKQKAKDAAAAERKRAKAAEKLEKAQKKANQTLLGFDEINKMNEESANDATDAIEEEAKEYEEIELKTYDFDPSDYEIDPDDYAIDPDDYEIDPNDFFVDPDDYAIDLSDYEVEPPDLSAFEEAIDGAMEGLKPDWDAFDVGKIEEKLSIIMGMIGVALMAVGLILIFSGVNIPLGFGMLVAGAILAYPMLAENWDAFGPQVQEAITTCIVFTGAVLMTVGLILILSGVNPPIGYGMLVAGATLLYIAAAVNWDALSPEVQGAIAVIMGILSLSFLVVGAVLAFSGANIPLGIGLMIAGAALLVADAVLFWDALPTEVQNVVSIIMGILGGALLMIGAILALTGVNIPLGVGLMVAGAAALAADAIINWDTIKDQLDTTIPLIEAAVGAAFLTIGAILAFSGANVPLGIALLAVGALSLGTAIIENWDTMPSEVQGVIATIELAVGAAFLTIGAILTFSGANVPLGIGLLVVGALAMAHALTENWGTIPSEVQNSVLAIESVVAPALLVIGAILTFSGANIPLGIALLAAGALSLVHLATLNWGEVPEETRNFVTTMLTIIGGALVVLGVILCVTGVGIPLGVACIVAGVASLVTAVAINWDFLVDKVREIWEKIKQFWNDNIAQVFTWQFWENIFKSIVNGLIGALNAGLNAAGGFINDLAGGLCDLLNFFGVEGFSFSIGMPQIPYLAQGAVIPPNREFLAVLGDQRSGNNIETPEGLMRQVVREEVGSLITESLLAMQGAQGSYGEGGDVTLVLQVGHEELARAVSKGNASRLRRGEISADLAFA